MLFIHNDNILMKQEWKNNLSTHPLMKHVVTVTKLNQSTLMMKKTQNLSEKNFLSPKNMAPMDRWKHAHTRLQFCLTAMLCVMYCIYLYKKYQLPSMTPQMKLIFFFSVTLSFTTSPASGIMAGVFLLKQQTQVKNFCRRLQKDCK